MDLQRSQSKLQAISRVALFQSLTSSERELLAPLLELRQYKRGEAIIISDRAGCEVMFIVEGSVYVKKCGGEGREVILSRLATGECFGEIALLTAAKRSADVVAAERCKLLLLPQHEFERLVRQSAKFNKALMKSLAQRVAAASGRIADFALLDVYCRLWSTLHTIAERDTRGAHVVHNVPTHRELAAMVGTSREMVTRALARLEEEGRIYFEDEKLVLNN